MTESLSLLVCLKLLYQQSSEIQLLSPTLVILDEVTLWGGGEKDCLGSVYGEATFVPVYLAFSVLCEAICTALYCFKKLGKMCNWDLLVYFLLFEKVELRTVLIFWEYSVQKSDSLKQVPKIKKKVTKKETWVIHLLLYFDNLLFDIYPILSKMFDFRMELKMSGNTQTLSRHFL